MKGHCYLEPPKVFTERHSLTSGEYIIRAISLRPEIDSEDWNCSSICGTGYSKPSKCKECEYFHEIKQGD